MIVGTLLIPKSKAESIFSSTSTLTNVTSGYFDSIDSSLGINDLQGPHHLAQ